MLAEKGYTLGVGGKNMIEVTIFFVKKTAVVKFRIKYLKLYKNWKIS